MAVGQFERADDECYVDLAPSNLHDRIASGRFGYFDGDARMTRSLASQQGVEKAASDQAMNTDAQATAFSRRRHAGGLHGMVELVDARCYSFDKKAAGFRQPNAARISLEKKDTQFFLQHPYSSANARLAGPECLSGVTEIEMLGYCKRLDQRNKRDSYA